MLTLRSKGPETPPSTVTLVIMVAISVLSLNLFLPSLANMADTFGVDYATMTQAISGYFAATGLVQLILAPLSDRVGRRPVILIGFGLFTAASLLAALAPTFEVFIAARVLQCAVVSGSALGAAIVRDTAPPNEAAGRLGQIGAAMALAPMVGPLVEGFLDTALGWRGNFGAYTLIGGAAFVLIWLDLGETAPARGRSFDEQFRAYGTLLKDLRFWSNALTVAFSAGVFFLFITGTPLVAATFFGMSTAEVGLAMATTPAGYLLGNLITSKSAGKIRLSTMLLVGRLLTVAGVSLALFISLYNPISWVFFGLMMFIGIGNGLTMPAAYSGAMSVRPDLAGSASGLTGALTVAAGAIMTGLAGSLISANPDPKTLASLLLAASLAALAAGIAVWATDSRKPLDASSNAS